MLKWRLSDDPVPADADSEVSDPEFRKNVKTKIFLAYTSNLVSAGVREHIRFLAQHCLVDVMVTTAGGIEEDFIKCMAPTYTGDFALKGAQLRMKGLNRVGNMLVPNSNYCKFEDWIMPILDQMLKEQNEDNVNWTPSKMIHRLGKEINHPESIYYWTYKHNIPVFCPAITDGSIGDMLFFHSYKSPGLRVDVVEDIRRINDIAMRAAPSRTGIVVLGGGVPKHHVCNANLMRNGADFAVYVNTAQEFDGSDSGAKPDEAISWGKIRIDAKPVKVCGDATILFPLIMSQTFIKELKRRKEEEENKVNAAGSVCA
uniref:Deoxyhypusine synthase n=1 Tax=Polytomella parva TaxID=51329 RepID=A0A7S0VGR4_9CHLO